MTMDIIRFSPAPARSPRRGGADGDASPPPPRSGMVAALGRCIHRRFSPPSTPVARAPHWEDVDDDADVCPAPSDGGKIRRRCGVLAAPSSRAGGSGGGGCDPAIRPRRETPDGFEGESRDPVGLKHLLGLQGVVNSLVYVEARLSLRLNLVVALGVGAAGQHEGDGATRRSPLVWQLVARSVQRVRQSRYPVVDVDRPQSRLRPDVTAVIDLALAGKEMPGKTASPTTLARSRR